MNIYLYILSMCVECNVCVRIVDTSIMNNAIKNNIIERFVF